MLNFIKRKIEKYKKYYRNIRLQHIIWLSFSFTAATATIIMGLSFYSRFSSQMQMEIQKEEQSFFAQVNQSLASFLRGMMKLSDSLYYGVLKDKDIRMQDFSESFRLLYETNRDTVKNISLFLEDGTLVVTAPAATLKDIAVPQEETWFQAALQKSENLHFSNPHVQNLFIDSTYQYEWVISLSRAVSITDGPFLKQGVLLVELRYPSLQQLFGSVSLGKEGYLYLIDGEGNLIYHPRIQVIHSGWLKETNLMAAGCKDGVFTEKLEGVERTITVKSVGYTGWKIVGVSNSQAVSLRSIKSNLFFLFLFLFFFLILGYINSYLSLKVTKPIQSLELAVKEAEAGNLDACIKEDGFIDGFYEVYQLGKSVQNMSIQMKKLMQDIVKEHESKRKSELDVLQSQINPHFLYNTLDIIVWMIENEKQQDAARVVTALARFFRISLSRGKTIIPVRAEIEHVRNYLMIQKMRFKNRFEYEIKVEEGLEEMAVVKLILQPLVENAIYHGMEFMDGDGKILVLAYKEKDTLIFCVEDNGLGMTEEKVAALFSKDLNKPVSKQGSGIGVSNVRERIRLHFGEEYGVFVESEPDEGTKVFLTLPITPYEEVRS